MLYFLSRENPLGLVSLGVVNAIFLGLTCVRDDLYFYNTVVELYIPPPTSSPLQDFVFFSCLCSTPVHLGAALELPRPGLQ